MQSDSVGGKVEVWSEEGVGTEIKVIFTAEAVDDDGYGSGLEPLAFDDPAHPPTVSLAAFQSGHRGVKLLRTVLESYLVTWWGFVVQQNNDRGDIVIINEDPSLVEAATHRKDTSRPFIILSASRGDAHVLAIANDHERIGGFCRVFYKPGGPSRLRSALKICLDIFKIKSRKDILGSGGSIETPHSVMARASQSELNPDPTTQAVEDNRPTIPSSSKGPSILESDGNMKTLKEDFTSDLKTSGNSTIAIGSGGSLLKSSIGIINAKDLRFRVLVVEDNSILRNLMCVSRTRTRTSQYF